MLMGYRDIGCIRNLAPRCRMGGTGFDCHRRSVCGKLTYTFVCIRFSRACELYLLGIRNLAPRCRMGGTLCILRHRRSACGKLIDIYVCVYSVFSCLLTIFVRPTFAFCVGDLLRSYFFLIFRHIMTNI